MIYCKNPERIPVKTRLAATLGAHAAEELYRLCLVDLKSRLIPALEKEASDLKIVIAPSDPQDESWAESFFDRPALGQIEGTLGERMRESILQAFARPETESAMIIGSDSPGLPPEPLMKGFDWLKNQSGKSSLCLGPSLDGGFYAIGANQKNLDFLLSPSIPWSTKDALARTEELAKAQGFQIKTLESYFDIDEARDLQRLESVQGFQNIARSVKSN